MKSLIDGYLWMYVTLSSAAVTLLGLGYLIILLVRLYDKVMTYIVTWFSLNKLFIQFIRERAAQERKARK